MTDTTFVSKTTPIPTAWLQDLNDLFYKGTKPLTLTGLTVNGNASITGTLGVTGATTLIGGIASSTTLTGTLTTTISIKSPILDSGSGNLVLKGAGATGVTIDNAGNTTLSGTLGVTGTSSVGALSVNGAIATVFVAGSANRQFQVDSSVASVATGIKIKVFASGGGVAISAISPSGAETLSIDALGTGAIQIGLTSSGNVILGGGGGDIRWNRANIALGGGAAPTVGTIGGSGPAAAGQRNWLRFIESDGTASFIPVWR